MLSVRFYTVAYPIESIIGRSKLIGIREPDRPKFCRHGSRVGALCVALIEEDRIMSDAAIHDRAAGAIMGAFIGDALGLGPHWYYHLAELRRDYGDWITTYTDPKPGRYHSGLRAGQL